MSKEITHYRVEIADGSGIIGAANEFSKTVHKVVAENDLYLVINDLRFTTIAKGKDRCQTSLHEESVCIEAGDRVWGNRVTYSLYTDKTKTAASIKKTIEKAILKKVGFFMNGIDLSIVAEATVKGGAA